MSDCEVCGLSRLWYDHVECDTKVMQEAMRQAGEKMARERMQKFWEVLLG